ncbi:MAG: hypothetical protein GOMPHAMPRED_007808 [Gomphillus americanus]|uniref:Amidohydrolase-related domain-containing protein n=1 Tax=Gomphillus americanus TaxID=1940652 RepID=A0A8H3IGL1_9LECA|nr:MAG: hypothetical protein GOMPHAMPRED_007808 [Gomphillus americanus]
MTRSQASPSNAPAIRIADDGHTSNAIQINNYVDDEHEQGIVRIQKFSMAFGQSFGIPTTQPPVSPLKKVTVTVVRTKLLIPGDDDPVADAALVIENKLIAWIGPKSEIPSKYTDNAHKAVETPYLMPGLWDCHLHFIDTGLPTKDEGNYAAFIATHPATNGARLAKDCWKALQNGYTSVRDLAGMGCEVAIAVNEGTIVGPNIYSAGACLSQLAGHGDIFGLPAGIVAGNLGVTQVPYGFMGTGVTVIADGVDECRKATRLQIRRGAKCIKVLASGGVLSRDDDVTCAQYSSSELSTIVAEANRQKRIVAAHVHANDAIRLAVNLGVGTVEHNSFADEETIKLIKQKNVIYVATRYIVQMLLKTGGEGIDPASWEKAKLCATNHLKAYKLAVQHGCTIALGSDTTPGDEGSAQEIQFAVEAGLSNLEAIKAATANGPLTVAGQAPQTGQLKVGYEADILGVLENPVEDVKVLQNKDNIRWVWKGGKLFKGPGIGPWGEE